MKINYTKKFIKNFKKSPKNIQSAFYERLELFLNNRDDSSLNIHCLSGEYTGYKSMNITGDWRAIFKLQDQEIIWFLFLGTHSKLYG